MVYFQFQFQCAQEHKHFIRLFKIVTIFSSLLCARMSYRSTDSLSILLYFALFHQLPD